MNVRFYLDENVNPALAEQLQRQGREGLSSRPLCLCDLCAFVILAYPAASTVNWLPAPRPYTSGK